VRIAAEHQRLRGAIVQVPMLDGLLADKDVPLARQLRFGLDILLALHNPFGPRYIPIVSAAGAYTSMTREGAWRGNDCVTTNLKQLPDNRVAARSLATMAFYRPFKHLRSIQIPTLVIGATRDTVVPFDEAKVRRMASETNEIRTIHANHFDPYLEPWFEENFKLQLDFATRIIKR